MASLLPLQHIDRPVASKRVTRDRGQLSMIRCDQCREDKQKCLPLRRTWPTKCNRCEKRGLPCSEGRRAPRRRKGESANAAPLPDPSSTAGIPVDPPNIGTLDSPLPDGNASADSTPTDRPISGACAHCRIQNITCPGDTGDGSGCTNCKQAVRQCLFAPAGSTEAPMALDSVPAQVAADPLGIEIRHMSFLMLYRRNLRVALDRLRGLEQELEELLPIYGKEGLGFYGDSKTIDQFQQRSDSVNPLHSGRR
ncbi:hypothetical protein BU26DRAFT_549337 [Trematosphaeria pertusa]|uniref:Zn(2)-C6 fungal-type domain-containing protein n=1 Tax=Trematosphaeria pertusa TaxID=390896 RepID=A0A6A6IM91_9PLEO|nr:uncharacterized protein BU26DRAFT_549337 [Trematosphaeria pertusa]KAF2250603.1 hypothetical protein BU26DRAFT_549337 [Trematosphaeria pertusa]